MIEPYIDELTQLPVISYETVIDNNYNLTQEEVKYFVNFISAEEVKDLAEKIISLWLIVQHLANNIDNYEYYADEISDLKLTIDIILDDYKNNEDFWQYLDIDLEEAIMRVYKISLNTLLEEVDNIKRQTR